MSLLRIDNTRVRCGKCGKSMHVVSIKQTCPVNKSEEFKADIDVLPCPCPSVNISQPKRSNCLNADIQPKPLEAIAYAVRGLSDDRNAWVNHFMKLSDSVSWRGYASACVDASVQLSAIDHRIDKLIAMGATNGNTN